MLTDILGAPDYILTWLRRRFSAPARGLYRKRGDLLAERRLRATREAEPTVYAVWDADVVREARRG